MDQFKLKRDREGFLGGKNEIYISMTTIWQSGYNAFTDQPDESTMWGRDYKRWELHMINIFRSEIGDTKTLNDELASNWGGKILSITKVLYRDPRRDAFVYVIYELDGWPNMPTTKLIDTSGKTLSGKSGKNIINLYYRSKQAPLAHGFFDWYQGSNNYACGESADNTDVKFLIITKEGVEGSIGGPFYY